MTGMPYSSAACLVVTFCLTASNTFKIPPPDKTKGTRFLLKIRCLTVPYSVFSPAGAARPFFWTPPDNPESVR